MNLIRTTVVIPEDMLRAAKLFAIAENKTVSDLIRDGLRARLRGIDEKKIEDPMSLLGKFSLGATKIYKKRSDLYAEHTKRKMGH